MIFAALSASLENGELLLYQFGMCRFHRRRDGVLTIYEILVQPNMRGGGIGRRLVERLKYEPGVTAILAKCPVDLPANRFWAALGFSNLRTETLPSGRQLNVWRLNVTSSVSEPTRGRCR